MRAAGQAAKSEARELTGSQILWEALVHEGQPVYAGRLTAAARLNLNRNQLSWIAQPGRFGHLVVADCDRGQRPYCALRIRL